LWENFASYTKEIGKQLYRFTGILSWKEKNPYYSLRGSEVPLQSEQCLFRFQTEIMMLSVEIYIKNELCLEDYHMIIMESTFRRIVKIWRI
jgi:hypothetical protein